MGFNHKANSCSMLQLFLLTCSCSCFLLGFCTAIDTLRVNESIQDHETLVSNEQKFKLGFFSPVDSSYRYVGVMYNLPVMTVIWVANRDTPLNDSNGKIEISGDGNLVVLDGKRELIWSSNLSISVVSSSAQLLDTGNLVLRDNSNGRTLWESFEHASDSFVATMKLGTNLNINTNKRNILTSWRSPSDPAPGRFTFTIEPLEIPESFIWNGSYPYWRSGPWNGQIFSGLPNMKSFYKHGLDLVNDSPGNAYLTFTHLNSSIEIYYVLNSSGVLQEKVWSDEKGDWNVTRLSLATDCELYGRCGPFGICNAKGKPICNCFPGFVPRSEEEWDAANWTSGCVRKTPLLCEEGNSAKEDGFLKLKKVKLPYHLKWSPTFIEECRGQCLNNCSCIAYAYDAGIGCMLWSESLIDVQQFSSGGADLYIRLANSELGNKKDQKAIIISTTVLSFFIILLCVYFMWKFSLKYRGKMDTGYPTEKILKDDVKFEELPLFKFEILSNATDNFNLINKLGQGGFGPVYKGKLLNGQAIAVKRLATSSNQGVEEFMNEVEVISKLQHRNLVRLLGCCVESDEKMLVYEYMPNGSLDAYLFGSDKKEFLDWHQRVMIIEGICRGLLYLHRDSRLRIIHRDLKPSNILLDEELNPKISDFGTARIFGGKEDQANTIRVVGTYGYMAPEYALEGRFSEKSDVYSFGVLLLEIVSGKRNTRFYDDEQGQSLIAYAWKLWNEENVVKLMDQVLYDPKMKTEVMRYAHVGLLCVQEKAKSRPNISTVLSMLSSEIVELPRPTQPAFLVSCSASETESSKRSASKCSVNGVTLTIGVGR
ncbi:hypothetical protein ACJIZ3_006543 [Penstemon smallii]|uniref:Receptor-like serine/threonine-protein kinase n=1 Tax=Penstemon smallii TaxID=265156 RepID=A0ABD3S874_9LAMI